MGKNRSLFLFVVLTMVIQLIFINDLAFLYSPFPFMDGVPVVTSYLLEYRILLYWYLPVVGMSFYFSGYFRENLYHYGKFIMIRSSSKVNWMINRYLSMICILLGFVIFQVIIFYLFFGSNKTLNGKEFIELFLMYFLTLFLLLGIQLLIELYIPSHVAHLLINLYIIFSIIITKPLLMLPNSPKFISYLFIPNYGMGFRTSLSKLPAIQKELIYYPTGSSILIILSVTIVLFTTFRIKRMDIF